MAESLTKDEFLLRLEKKVPLLMLRLKYDLEQSNKPGHIPEFIADGKPIYSGEFIADFLLKAVDLVYLDT